MSLSDGFPWFGKNQYSLIVVEIVYKCSAKKVAGLNLKGFCREFHTRASEDAILKKLLDTKGLEFSSRPNGKSIEIEFHEKASGKTFEFSRREGYEWAKYFIPFLQQTSCEYDYAFDIQR